jgi:hypothetical protein
MALDPNSDLSYSALVGLDHDLVVHREDGHRAGAVGSPLVEEREREFQAVRPGALHGAAGPLENAFLSVLEPADRADHRRTVPSFGLDRPFS